MKSVFVKSAPFVIAAFFTVQVASADPAQISDDPSRLSLEVINVEVMDVLKLISKKTGLNLVAGKDIKGQVTILLRDVPIRDGVKTILQSQGLAYYEEDNIFKIITEKEYQDKFGKPFGDVRVTKGFLLRYQEASEMASTLSQMKSPQGRIIVNAQTNSLVVTETPQALSAMEEVILQTDLEQVSETIDVKYARIDELEARLKDFADPGKGRVVFDKRANKIYLLDIPSRVAKIRSLVNAFDVELPQVLIEAKIIEVRLNDNYRQGINWSSVLDLLKNAGSLNLSVPLTVSAPSGGTLTTITSTQSDLTLILQAIDKMGKTNTLSSPRITTLDNKEAKLSVATKQPYVSQTVVQTTNSTNTADNVQFVDVGVTLAVTPRVLADGMVEMQIKPQVSASSSSLELEGVSSGSNTPFVRTRIPIVTTQELETTVSVKSGTTIIIGGLIQDSQDKQAQKVPLIGDIPGAGHFFRSKANDFSKTELVVFLTPTLDSTKLVMDAALDHDRFFDASGQLKEYAKVGAYQEDPAGIESRALIEPARYPFWKKEVNTQK